MDVPHSSSSSCRPCRPCRRAVSRPQQPHSRDSRAQSPDAARTRHDVAENVGAVAARLVLADLLGMPGTERSRGPQNETTATDAVSNGPSAKCAKRGCCAECKSANARRAGRAVLTHTQSTALGASSGQRAANNAGRRGRGAERMGETLHTACARARLVTPRHRWAGGLVPRTKQTPPGSLDGPRNPHFLQSSGVRSPIRELVRACGVWK